MSKKDIKFTGPSELFFEELQAQEDEEDIKMFKTFKILNNILKEFDKQFPILQLLGRGSTFDQKRYEIYKYSGLSYRATIYNYLTGTAKVPNRQLTIKLSHDGFRYHSKDFLRAKIVWHGRSDYAALTEDILEEMPFLNSLKTQLKADILFLYSIKGRRTDITFQVDGKNVLMFTFEPGIPETFGYNDPDIQELYI